MKAKKKDEEAKWENKETAKTEKVLREGPKTEHRET